MISFFGKPLVEDHCRRFKPFYVKSSVWSYEVVPVHEFIYQRTSQPYRWFEDDQRIISQGTRLQHRGGLQKRFIKSAMKNTL